MAERALQLELSDPEPASILPWIVALAAGVALTLAFGERLVHIPDTLERQARERIDAAGASGVALDVDGRDITLGGELDAGIERRALVERIAAIDGVRRVRDELVVIDPAARDALERARFRDALAAMDTASVTFEPGSAALASGSDVALAALVRLMRDAPAFRIRVAGHTDSRGRPAINLALSRARAAAVAEHLAAHGVDPARVIAQGYGATQPLADNATESGRARNRRIEISYVD